MLKAVSIFLSMILLAQGFSLNATELEKMDELLEHAKFHKEEYGDNFALFLDKHYGNQKDQHGREHQEEKNDHDQLPFHHYTPLLIQPVFLDDQVFPDMDLTFYAESQKANYFYLQLNGSLLISEILQPPKYC